MRAPDVMIHATADVSASAHIGAGTKIWHHSQVREGARVGQGCIVGKDVYIDAEVSVGDHCKIQNGVYLYHGVVLEDGVFMGPRATTTNDLSPRAINQDGTPKGATDWIVAATRICRGAAIGAGAVLVCGITVGPFAMVAAGSVVTRSVPSLGLVMGNPARLRGAVCPCGARLRWIDRAGQAGDPVSGDPGEARHRSLCAACGTLSTLEEAVAATLRQQISSHSSR